MTTTDRPEQDPRPRVEVDPGVGTAFDEARAGGGFVCAGAGFPSGRAAPLAIEICPYVCPWCTDGAWQDGTRCLHCSGSGVAKTPDGGVDADGNDTTAQPLPRPPGVMRRSCTDCAYRPGSYEQRSGMTLPDGSAVFFCHHGLHRTGPLDAPGYVAPVMVAGMPIGAMVCGAWWDIHVEGREPPAIPFRDPGGSDRADDAPPEDT